ncbi:MAG: hypothetical protein HY904_08120 [Deltaproteobacteria bacterium]|nr:hypothetical protein [Deltaproteobacteria bacterium]
MKRVVWVVVAVSAGLAWGCARRIPEQGVNANLPPLAAQPTGESLAGVVLGPAGREAMLGEFKLVPEAMGLTITGLTSGAQLGSAVVFCTEPRGWLEDGTLVVDAGMTWWPPGVEPKYPTRSITEGLMRCLGYLGERKPWARAVVYLRPSALPRVEAQLVDIQAEGTDTVVEALQHAFLFGIEAIFQSRGLTLSAGTQDGLVVDEQRGLRRDVEAHSRHTGRTWSHSNKVIYSAGAAATGISVFTGHKANTVVEGVSYVVGHGEFGQLLPVAVTRAAFRLKTGVARSMVTLNAQMRAWRSPGLSCVLRALSPPVQPSTDGGPADATQVPGVDLEAAQKCVLTDDDQSGPALKIK